MQSNTVPPVSLVSGALRPLSGMTQGESMKSRRAFSLIELLVTISIIAVMIGILLPTIPRVRDAARRAACGSNLRSVGQAVELYKGDFKEMFPTARYMPPPWLSGDTDPPLTVMLDDYFGELSPAWRCPGDRVVSRTEFTDDNGRTREGGVSYSYISGLSGQRFEESWFYTFLRFEPHQAPVAHDFDGGTFETQDGREVTADFFHASRNILFVDGHVGKTETPEHLATRRENRN